MRSLAAVVSLLFFGGQWAVAQSTFKVGVAQRAIVPKQPFNWRGAETGALLTTIWYPADSTATEEPQWIGPANAPLFAIGSAAAGAKPAGGRFPLIVLSHGTGGSALQMGWLGIGLAAHGYIAAAVNHPGNNALEAYTPQGFSLWWERARDMSEVIDHLLMDTEFRVRIDSERIGAAGFSLGGYTMIEIAGGISARAAFQEFCNSPAADGMCKSPPEFPDLLDYRLDDAAKQDPEIAASLQSETESRRDRRVRAAFAIAPALGPAFESSALEKIGIPVQILAGAEDDIVPVETSAEYFAAHIPDSKLVLLEGGVQHYTFLAPCTMVGRENLPELCNDRDGVDRNSIHEKTIAMAVEFFDTRLGKPGQ